MTEEKAKKAEKTFIYYHVEVLKIKDGDTFRLKIDMGNATFWEDDFRLLGVDTPEEHGKTREKGEAATRQVESLLELFGIKRVQTFSKDKYGRWLVAVTLRNGTDLSECLIMSGNAVPYFGGKKGV